MKILHLFMFGGALCNLYPTGTPHGIKLADQRACPPAASNEDIQMALQNIKNDMAGNLMILHEELKLEIGSKLRETAHDEETRLRTSLDVFNTTVNNLQLQTQQLGNELSNKSSESFSVQQKLLEEQGKTLHSISSKTEEQSEAVHQKVEQLTATLQEMETRLEEQKQDLLEMLEQSLREHKENLQQLSERMGEELQQTKDDLSATKAMLQEALETIRPQNDKIRQLSLWEEYGHFSKALDCTHHWQRGRKTSGVYIIFPIPEKPGIEVMCNMTDEGGWTVILSRSPQPIQENFSRNWTAYKDGFGNASAEYWIGLEALHAMTNRTKHQLHMEMITFGGNFESSGARDFHVENESSKYRVTIENCYGIIDRLRWNNGKSFSTVDEDNDMWESGSCAQKHGGGGWWYNSCGNVFPTGCKETNPPSGRMCWYSGEENRHYPLSHIVMAIRPL